MRFKFLLFTILTYCTINSQNAVNEDKIQVMLLNCFEGSIVDEVKRDYGEYFGVYEKKKYTTTNFDVKKYNRDSLTQPVFIFEGLKTKKNFSTNGRWINRKLFPGETIRFSLPKANGKSNGGVHSIYIKGKLIETENNEFPYFSAIKDYELRVVSKNKNESLIKMDVSAFNSGGFEGGIYLYWIGDLNSDGQLDMLVGTSYHYAGIGLTLYLSDIASEELFNKHKVGTCSAC